MRYFVTGGAGFIGSNFVEFLLREVENVSLVTVYDKFTYASNVKNLTLYGLDSRLKVSRGDICDFNFLNSEMIGHDIVVNFAAESHVDRSIANGSIFAHTNVLGTQNVLEASRQRGVSVVLHVSTDEVYGSIEKGSAVEESKLHPNSPYSASKASSDLFARSYAITHELDVRITRACNNFGRFQFPEKLIPVIIRNLSRGIPVPIFGTGNNVREWIHVLDHCKAIQLVIEKGKKGEIYNVGSGFEITNIDLAKTIVHIMGADASLLKYVNDRKGHDFRYSLNSNKLMKLGFELEQQFIYNLGNTIDWYLKNPNWWEI